MSDLGLPQDALQALAKQTLHDRIVGCLFGSALGDAIGLYTEFLSADMSRRAYPTQKFILSPESETTQFRRDSHRNPHAPGEWTDDTDHALCILLSYLHTDGKEMNPQDFASRLHTWVRFGLRALDTLPLGLGKTVGAIVRSKTYLEDPEKAARLHWKNSRYNAAPNGSLMRTHPLGPMCINKTLDETFRIAADYSVVTHVDPRCIISCVIGTALIRGILRHEVYLEDHIDDMIDKALLWYSDYHRCQLENDPGRRDEPDLDLNELHRHAKVKSLAELELDDGYKIGYVYKTFGSGIYLLRLAMRQVAASNNTIATRMAVFEPLITDLIMCGGDADTNACFAGALIGAYLGYNVLPRHWRDGLRHGDWFMKKAEGLSDLLGISDKQYVGSEDADTALDGGREWPTDAYMEKKVMLLQAEMVKREQKRDKEEQLEKGKGRSSWLSNLTGRN